MSIPKRKKISTFLSFFASTIMQSPSLETLKMKKGLSVNIIIAKFKKPKLDKVISK